MAGWPYSNYIALFKLLYQLAERRFYHLKVNATNSILDYLRKAKESMNLSEHYISGSSFYAKPTNAMVVDGVLLY